MEELLKSINIGMEMLIKMAVEETPTNANQIMLMQYIRSLVQDAMQHAGS